jgi:membrane protein DedA with SNARE-associated domain
VDPTTWGAPFPIVVAALFVIVMARAGGTYWIGRAIAAGAEHTRMRRLLQSKGYTDASRWIDRWGPPAVTLSFLTVGIQTLVNLAAGVMRMPMRHYVPALAVGGVIWALIYSTVGFVGVAAFRLLWDRAPLAAVAVGVVATAALAWWIVSRVLARHGGDTAQA